MVWHTSEIKENRPGSKLVERGAVATVVILAIGAGGLVALLGIIGGGTYTYRQVQERRNTK